MYLYCVIKTARFLPKFTRNTLEMAGFSTEKTWFFSFQESSSYTNSTENTEKVLSEKMDILNKAEKRILFHWLFSKYGGSEKAFSLRKIKDPCRAAHHGRGIGVSRQGPHIFIFNNFFGN